MTALIQCLLFFGAIGLTVVVCAALADVIRPLDGEDE